MIGVRVIILVANLLGYNQEFLNTKNFLFVLETVMQEVKIVLLNHLVFLIQSHLLAFIEVSDLESMFE